MRNYTFLLVVVFLLIGGCESNNKSDADSGQTAIARKIAVSKAAGESVLVVSGEVVTGSDILQSPIGLNGTFVSPAEHLKPLAQKSSLPEFKKLAKPMIEEILMGKVSDILLYQEARRQLGDKNIDETLEKEADKEVKKFFIEFGGDEAKAEENLKQMGLDRQKYKENRKRFVLTQWYIATRLTDNKPVTHRELMECYNQMKQTTFFIPARLEFRLIDIQPEKLEIVDANESQLEQAGKLANRLIEQIKAGDDFGELAGQYSHGLMREFGGLWKPVAPDSLAEPYDVLAVEAQKLQPGQVAGPIEVEGHIFIMKLEDKRLEGYEPFDKVQTELEKKIFYDRRKKALDKLDAELTQQVDVSEKDKFIDFCLEKVYQMKEDPQ